MRQVGVIQKPDYSEVLLRQQVVFIKDVDERLPCGESHGSATHQRLVRSQAPIYAPSWASLSTNQQKALAAAASMDGAQLLSRPILNRYDLSPGTMQKALQALEAQSSHS